LTMRNREDNQGLDLGRQVTILDYMKELCHIAMDAAQPESVRESASRRFFNYFEEASEAMEIDDREVLRLIELIFGENDDDIPDSFEVETVPEHGDKMVQIIAAKLSEVLGDSLIGKRLSISGPRSVDGLVIGMNNLYWTIGQLPRRPETVFESILFPVELLGSSRVLVMAEDENGTIKI